MMSYIDASCIMSLEGCSLNVISDIFPQTSQITSGVLLCLFLLIICTVNLESLKSELLWSVTRKLTPCCRNDDIFTLTLFRSIFTRGCFLFDRTCFWTKLKDRGNLWMNWFMMSSYFNHSPLFDVILVSRARI